MLHLQPGALPTERRTACRLQFHPCQVHKSQLTAYLTTLGFFFFLIASFSTAAYCLCDSSILKIIP